jgi:hypothetical protein
MKITKEQLRQIIKEELEEAQQAVTSQPKLKSDVGRVAAKLEKTPGMEGLLAAITNRPEFEQIMLQFIEMVSKEKLKPEDVKAGIRYVANRVLKAK